MVPKGLQIRFKPATSELSASNKTKWQEVLSKASLDLIPIIIDHYKSCTQDLQHTEARLLKKLAVHESECLIAYEERKRNKLNTTKQKKFLRDGLCTHERKFEVTKRAATRSNDSKDQSSQIDSSVVNLSNIVLSNEQMGALSKGLNFCPASGGFNEFQLLKDLHNFSRNLRLREYYHDRRSPNETRPALPTYKQWTPPPHRDRCLDIYINAVQRDIFAAYKKTAPYRHNLSKKEKVALEQLSTNHDIVIKPADKGGAIVILNAVDYISEAERQLSDATFYKALPSDPTSEFKSKLKDALTSLLEHGKLDEKTVRSLVPLSPVAGRFYMLPKIHKQNNPGRPIISGIGTVTENLSRYVDSLINKIPATFPSFIKDTNHFLQEIVDLHVPSGSMLVTLDVASLYTNIPHKDGISAVIKAYENSPLDKPIDKEALGTLLKLILELNNFEFNNIHYVQANGTSMGTKVGPNYANIFMGILECEFLGKNMLQPLYYRRFIDDIFLVWTHDEASLLGFIQKFNNFHPSIKFSHQFSRTSVNFLDVTVTISEGQLATKLFRKPTDRHQLLHFQSSHPRHCKTGIPYSQAHRFKRLCSDRTDFIENCNRLKSSLVKRKYPEKLIDDAITRADQLNRTEILKGKDGNDSSAQTNLVLTFSSSAPKVSAILKRHHNILTESDNLKKIFSVPPRVVYRRSKNLHDMLTSSKIGTRKESGCAPCNKPRCKVCVHMQTTQNAASTSSDFKLKIRGSFDCDTYNAVYMLECSACLKQYIGHTETPFRIRFNNHKSHVNIFPHLPLSRHVRMPGHSFDQMKATILESGFRSNHDRELRESYLIFKFNTVADGINEDAGTLTCLPST